MQKLRLLLIMGLLLTVAASVKAVPAKPVKKTVTMADGTQQELTLRGDEHFSYYIDDEGHHYMMNAQRVAESVTGQTIAETWTKRKHNRLAALAQGSRARQKKVGQSGTTTGRHRGLVILMQFPDQPFVTPDPQAVFTRFFNEKGYSDFGMAGSVRDYFLEQSYGQLEIDFDVVGPYTTRYNMAYYGEPTDNSNDARPTLMVAQAVDSAAQHVNYANYDWDNDGEVDQVFVIYAGYNEAQGADANTIWPHEWSLAVTDDVRRYNGVTISTYGCSSELKGNGRVNTGILDGIGTACHEFSHCLGLPDMYDTQGNNYAMGYWDVMCAGSYNGNSCTPAGYTAYERMFSGWLTPTEINSMTRIKDMKPLAESPEAYILYNEANRNEYYLLENRQPVGFDAGLNGHGLLVVHVDFNMGTWMSNQVNTVAEHQRMTIIPADDRANNGSESGDPFPGTRKVTELTNYTSPAATLYNYNVDGTKLMSKPLDNITENTEELTVSFVACRPELPSPKADDGEAVEGQDAFTVTWAAIDGALGYELELTEIGSAATDPTEALLREYDFSECVSKTTGFSDISSKLANYGLSGFSGSKLYTSPSKLKIGTSASSGYITTPSWWGAPSSLELTFVMGADIVSSEVEGTLKLESVFTNGYTKDIVSELQSFKVTGNSRQVFSFTIPKQNDQFRLTIQPSSQMYVNYLAIYDGIWTAEQLDINSGSRSKAPLFASAVPQYFDSETNSYTFTGLNTKNRYIYRVRAIGEENTFSQWSEEKTFSFSTDGIETIEADRDGNGRYYDLMGRPTTTPRRGIYIRNGRKVVF